MWGESSASEARKLVHHKVEIKRKDSKSNIGWVYTVDPLTFSIVLYEEARGNEKEKLTLVFKHAVEDVILLRKPCERIDEILNKIGKSADDISYSEEELKKRKTTLQSWLEKNRLPVKVDGENLKISDSLEILPPYTTQSCQSRNEVILSRVQAIMDLMPSD